MAIRAKYKGDGEFYHGIPARDLDEDEWQVLDNEQRQLLRSSALYDVKTDREMEPPRKREGGED